MVERTLISFPSQLQLIDRLQHLLYLSSSITFISGEAGSGKSTLVEQLSNLLPDDTQQAFISLYQTTPAAQIRQQIIAQLFEEPLFNAEDSLANILFLLKDSQKSDVSRAVVIDNAELLPAQLLTELAEVVDQKSSFTDHEISFILLSDDIKTSQMVNTIKQLPSNLKVATLTFKLAPLTAKEAKQLLNHRFQQIGYSPQIEHQDAIALQLSRCQGIPEKILALAAQVSSGQLDDRKLSWMKNGLPAILVMFVFIIIAASLAYYLYPKLIKSDPQVDIIIETDALLPDSIDATELITNQSSDINIDTISDSESTEALAGQWKSTTQNVNNNQLRVGQADAQQRVIISDQQLIELSAPESQKTPQEIDNSGQSDLSSEILEESSIKSNASVSEEEESISEVVNIDADDNLPSIALKDQAEAQVLQPVIEQQEPQNPLPLKVEAESETNRNVTSNDTLFAVNPNFYTLQLAGFASETSLNRFIGQHNLPQKDVYIYQTLRDEKPWYVVIYGQYESREIATSQAQELPGTFAKLNTWVKKYALVHQDLQRNE